MFEFKYDITKREDGRPILNLPDDFQDEPEHRFMVMEMAVYFLDDLLKRYKNSEHGIHEQNEKILIDTIDFLADISDNMAMILLNQMNSIDELKDILNKKNTDDGEDSI